MRRSFFLPLALAAVGCGDSTATTPMNGDGPAAEDLATTGNPGADLLMLGGDLAKLPGDMATVAGVYPAGPYGNKVGDTFPPLVWEGYVDDAADTVATNKTFGPYSMDAVRKSGRAYAMVHVSDFY